jgi:hypothetical protein
MINNANCVQALVRLVYHQMVHQHVCHVNLAILKKDQSVVLPVQVVNLNKALIEHANHV